MYIADWQSASISSLRTIQLGRTVRNVRARNVLSLLSSFERTDFFGCDRLSARNHPITNDANRSTATKLLTR